MVTRFFVACLAIIAGTVTVLQIKKKNAWILIVAYWVVLFSKNLFDWWGLL